MALRESGDMYPGGDGGAIEISGGGRGGAPLVFNHRASYMPP